MSAATNGAVTPPTPKPARAAYGSKTKSFDPEAPLRFALWSNGVMEIVSGKTRLLLNDAQCKQLRAYLTLLEDVR